MQSPDADITRLQHLETYFLPVEVKVAVCQAKYNTHRFYDAKMRKEAKQ